MRVPIRLLPCLFWLCAATALADDIEIRAELVEAEGLSEEGADKITATGDVRITAGDLTLFAPELTWTRDKARALLTGGVVGVDGMMFMHANTVDADLQTDEYALDRGEVMFKKKVSPAELARLTETDPDAALKCGVNTLTLRANEVGRNEDGVEARKVWMTTCECPAGCRPMFSITASSADIVPDERATLKWPVFWLFDLVPLFPPIPQLTLPLVDRKTGLLFPQFSFSGPGGVGVDVPYFITLGESADVTVTGQWFRGDRDDETGEFLDRSVRGFGAIAEFRWRPAEEAIGSLMLTWVHDVVPDKTGAIRGHRGTLALGHSQALLTGRFGLESRLASDTSALRDRSLALDAERAYLRTRATWSRTGRHLGVGVSTSALQDLRPQRLSLFEAPAVLAPVAHASVQGHGALGPAFADATVSFTAQRTTPGLELELAPGREALNVVSARVGQSMPLVTGAGGLVALEAGQRVDLQARLNGDTQWRGGAFAGVWARTRIGRTFGNGLHHEVLPSVRLRGFAVAGAPYASNLFALRRDAAPQAAVDVALPSSAALQLVTRLASTLTTSGGKRVAASVEHHLTLAPVDLGQIVGDLSLPLGPTRLSGGASMRLADRKITQASGGWSGHGKYAGLSFNGQYLAGTLNDRLASGLDMLFTPPEGVVADRSDRLVTAGGSLNVVVPFYEAVTARAGAALSRSLDVENSEWRPNAWAQLGYGVGGCGRLSVGLEWAPDKSMGLTFNFELSDLTAAVRTVSQ